VWCSSHWPRPRGGNEYAVRESVFLRLIINLVVKLMATSHGAANDIAEEVGFMFVWTRIRPTRQYQVGGFTAAVARKYETPLACGIGSGGWPWNFDTPEWEAI
jgi:hypothetical protein